MTRKRQKMVGSQLFAGVGAVRGVEAIPVVRSEGKLHCLLARLCVRTSQAKKPQSRSLALIAHISFTQKSKYGLKLTGSITNFVQKISNVVTDVQKETTGKFFFFFYCYLVTGLKYWQVTEGRARKSLSEARFTAGAAPQQVGRY